MATLLIGNQENETNVQDKKPMSCMSLTNDKKTRVKIIIHQLGNTDVFEKEIDSEFTLLELLRFLIQVNPIFKMSSFHLGSTKESITVRNSTLKLVDFVSENNIVQLFCVDMFSIPKNDLLEAENIVKIYDNHLENTINIDDVCCINHVKIGEKIDFEWSGDVYLYSPYEQNTLTDIIFIKHQNTLYAYNECCLRKMIDPKSTTVLIPHVNLKVNTIDFFEKLLFISHDEKFKIVDIDDIII